MSIQIRTEDQYIVEIEETEWNVTQYLIYHPLKSIPSVPESKGEAEEFEHTKRHDNRRLFNVILAHGHLVTVLVQIQFGEQFGTQDSGGTVLDIMERVAFWNCGGI